MPNSIIIATGSYIPTSRVPNEYFVGRDFYGSDGMKLERSTVDIIQKFQEITCITERRYVTDDLNTSDIAVISAQ